MRREYLLQMGEGQIDEYASLLGVDVSEARGAAAKIDLIEARRARVATIDVLGMAVEVPVKRLHDVRVTSQLDGRRLSSDEADALVSEIVGERQMEAIRERCTDEDGTVDMEAYALALRKVIYSEELKNF